MSESKEMELWSCCCVTTSASEDLRVDDEDLRVDDEDLRVDDENLRVDDERRTQASDGGPASILGVERRHLRTVDAKLCRGQCYDFVFFFSAKNGNFDSHLNNLCMIFGTIWYYIWYGF
jgi:hypothetical protein